MGLDQTWEHKAGEKTKGPGIQNKLKPRNLFSSSIIILSDGLHTFLTDECNNL